MKAAKKDDSGTFGSVLVHFRSDKARFHPTHFRFDRSFLSVPSAWHIKPMTEVGLKVQLPARKNGKSRSIHCRGIIVECRPLKHKGQEQKGHYHVDLFLTHVPLRYVDSLQKLRPTLELESL